MHHVISIFKAGRLAALGRSICIRPRATPQPTTPHQRYLATTIAGSPSSAIQLRPYQEDSIRAVLDYLANGEHRLGISLATGSGKTVIFSHLIDRITPPTRHATQTLILAHRRELVEQAARHCQSLYPGLQVDVEMGAQHASGLADITVASVASLTSGMRLHKYDPDRFKLVLVDEAHHIVAATYLDVLRHFNLLEKRGNPHTALVGVSATFSRSDGLSLGKAIDHIVYHKDYVDMIDGDWLSSVIFTTVQSGANLAKVKTSRGDFQTGSLSQAVNTDDINALTVRSWLAKAEGRKSTLVFCVDLAHVRSLTAMFRHHGIDARFVTGDTSQKLRKARLDAFKAGEFAVLLNCGIFTEGTDIPNIDCIILARPTRSRNLLVQMIGRGLRKHAGKQNCHIIDFVASLETGIVTTPTLFGLNPDELVDGANASDMKRLQERKGEQDERDRREEQRVANFQDLNPASSPASLTGVVSFTDYDTIHDLLSDTAGERHIRALSRFAWVQVDEARYILSNRTGEYLCISKLPPSPTSTDQRHTVTFTQRIPEWVKVNPESKPKSKSPFMRPRQIASTLDFLAAVRAADTFAAEKFPQVFIAKRAPWRSFPASAGQVAFLNKFHEEGEEVAEEEVTKGQAADWITKIKFGARGRFGRVEKERREKGRIEEKRGKEEEMKRQMVVKVGPLLS